MRSAAVRASCSAPGGGAILNAQTRSVLRERGTVIYLHSTAETSYERVRRNRDRPLLMVSDPLQRLRQLYAVRDPLYAATAHHIIESYRDRPTAVVNEIASLLAPMQQPPAPPTEASTVAL